ncbi:MAG: terminase family protein [Spirochaetaceae bacterium]|nr:terminase family protein [Spirochaetaceae bacterium]
MRLALQAKQARAYLARSTETLYGGAAGGGKSHLMRVAAIAWCLDIPGLQVYIFRRTHPDLWKNHMEGPSGFPALLAEFVKSCDAKINYSDGKITFSNGSTILLCHCQYEKDVYNYQGAEIHVLMIDELTQWPASMYKYLRGRVRMVGINLPEKYTGRFPRTLCGANPGGIGHNWVKGAWVDLGPGVHEMPKAEGGMRREYIPARLEDNPKLVEADPTYEDRLTGLGNAALVRAMRMGDWDIVAGGAIDDVWDRERHVVKSFRIPSSWRVDRSFDWGSAKPFSVGWWAESDGTEAVLSDGSRKSWPRGTLFRIHEWYGWPGPGHENEGLRMTSEEIGRGIKEREAEIRERLGIARIQAGPADASIYDEEDGDSIAAKIDRGFGQRGAFVPANKASGTRKQGLELLRSRLKASLAERMEEPGLFVFDACTAGFIRTVPVLPRDERNPDDVDSAAEDHAYDETRYRLLALKHTAKAIKLGAA